VIGAGIAGLTAAVELAARGLAVTVVERAERPGGKMREIEIGGARLDAGPTVFTLRRVFEEIFADAGASLADHVTLRPVDVLARHAWSADERLDLFVDRDRSADAIGTFAGPAEARRFRAFCDHARRIYVTLEQPFIRAPQPSLKGLIGGVGLRGLGSLWHIKPFETMWTALGDYFHDPRLRQLFGRYATYCGSSPYLAPATLMLVAHVELEGVWLVEGGMHRLAVALAELASRLGATFRYGTEVREVVVSGGRVAGVEFTTGERLPADAVVANADVAAVAGGYLGRGIANAIPPVRRSARSLSAVTWSLVAEAEGFPLLRHTVFFSNDYQAEFEDIFRRARLPAAPTVYVCALDRDDRGGVAQGGPERLLCLVNAPAIGDSHPFPAAEIEQCAERTFALLERCGLRVRRRPETTVVTTPAAFDRLFPATGGALYGQASHGWKASFERPGARTRIPGLYLAGGSAHPGPGVPMAALSGRMAATSLLADLASTSRSRGTAMSGGTSTR
jgi:1-hydroxycarotenoid 3,4-desaturase